MSTIASAVELAVRAEPRLRHLQSVIVVHAEDVVAERYFRDRRAEDLSNVHSVTKSVLSTLVGIAIDDGSLKLSTTIGDVLGERMPIDAAKAIITVEDLLTMTAGLASGGPYDIDEIADAGGSWVEGPLGAPLQTTPGTAFQYNNGAAHVLGATLAAATDKPLARFAEERLFEPLGIRTYRWPCDPDGNALGCGHLELRPRDLARLGELYLTRGRNANGVRVVDPSYVDAATTPATAGGPPECVAYGYLWWIAERGGSPAFFAGGFGGQYVTVVPALRLVVATTGDVDVFIPSSADALSLVDEVIIPSL
jgi:CubicO group peptidase (beta-lactamase class C family)